MKKNFKFVVFIFIFLFSQLIPKINAATTELPLANPDATISMDFQDTSLKDILKIFSIQAGVNFIASDSLQDRKVTLYLDKVPMKQAMDKLFGANNLYYELDKTSNIYIVKDWGKQQVETVTKIYQLKYQSVPSSKIVQEKSIIAQGGGSGSGSSSGANLTVTIKQLLSENGKLSEDPHTNSLIITDIPSRFVVIDQLIAKLDVPQVQIMLEVEMLDVSKNKTDLLGLKFGNTPIAMTFTGGSFDTDMLSPHSLLKKNLTAKAITRGNFDLSSAPYSVQLDFIRTQVDTKTLARPKILTLNNETAELKITAKESLNPSTTQQTETATSTSGVEREEVGISLRVTPQANLDTGEITMVIIPEVSETKDGITVQTSANTSYTAKDPEKRTTKSVVRVKDGDTIIIGGLIRTEYSKTITKLPFFGDLPLIGSLFRHKDVPKNRDRELIVFITPHIIKEGPGVGALAQLKKASLPEREQNTASGISRHAIIEASLNNFDRKR